MGGGAKELANVFVPLDEPGPCTALVDVMTPAEDRLLSGSSDERPSRRLHNCPCCQGNKAELFIFT